LAVLALLTTALALALPVVRNRSHESGYGVGEFVDVDGIPFGFAERTVLLFSRASCTACQSSKESFAGLVAAVGTQPNAQVVMVTGVLEKASDAAFARDIGIQPDKLIHTDIRRLRLRYVPAVVVTDRKGRILLAREGVLTESDRSDIMEIALHRRSD
jgi:hypothetical protein